MAVGKATVAAVNVLLWYRKGLRVHDSPALVAACDGAAHVYPVFCLDPWFVSSGSVGPLRLRFLCEALNDLDRSLKARGSRLLVLRGKPEEEIPRAIRKWGVERLVFESDGVEPYALARDVAVCEGARKAGVTHIVETQGHTLCDLDELLRECKGQPVTSYSVFQKHFASVVRRAPIAPVATPERIPSSATDSNCGASLSPPTVEEVAPDLAGTTSLFPGGETEALRRLAAHLALDGGKWATTFEKPQTNPTSLNPHGEGTRATTVLSPYLKFGCLSPRRFWVELHEATARSGVKVSQPPVSLSGQLLWREFYYTCAKAVGPVYAKMEGNPICRQIPWRDARDDADANAALNAWRDGRTGYPWIDAAMRQLRAEGHMHHLARHAVACFLTRGDLWISWEEGARVFDELLIDADWAINNGNWMWLSCSCFFYQYFRCYSPVAFGKKYDPDGTYIRTYVPELAAFPAKYIYEPWKAPIADQKKAGCRVGEQYPKPIVQHDIVSKENMGKMAEAYKVHKEGSAAAAIAGGKKSSSPSAPPAASSAAKRQRTKQTGS